MSDPLEDDLIEELVGRWTETHKKSMLMFVILVLLIKDSKWTQEIYTSVAELTGWSVTERGLYRVLQKMAAIGLVTSSEDDSPTSGAKRNVFQISPLGRRAVRQMAEELFSYLDNPEFRTNLSRA